MGKNIKFYYEIFNVFGDISRTVYSLEDNKFSIKLNSIWLKEESVMDINLTPEEMQQAEEIFGELGEFSKTAKDLENKNFFKVLL